MRIIIDTKYVKQNSATLISITFTCKSFYIEKDKIVFNNYVSINLNDVITVKATINGYDSTLYDDEKKNIISTIFSVSFIPTKIDNIKNVIEIIKRSVVKWYVNILNFY